MEYGAARKYDMKEWALKVFGRATVIDAERGTFEHVRVERYPFGFTDSREVE